MPDASFSLIFYYHKNGKVETYLTGIWDKTKEKAFDPGLKILAIKFKALASEYLFGKTLGSFFNEILSIDIKDFQLLQDLDLQDQDFASFAHVNDTKLQAIIGSQQGVEQRKRKLFESIEQSAGRVSLKEIAEQSAWSMRQMSRYFKEHLGLSTKQYLNIVRLKHSYASIANGELFPDQGHHDQSHFIKEVKGKTGVSPKELSKNKGDRFLQLSTQKKR